MRPTDAGPEHEAVCALLPWHANGTLDGSESSRVGRHLAECATCRDELALCRDAARAIASTADAGWEPSPGHLGRLMERLPATGEGPRAQASLPARVRAWWNQLPERARWILAAQSAVAAGLAGVILWQAASPQPRLYETLSTAESSLQASALRVDVAFAGDATVGELGELLRSIGGSIVEGPSALGVYTVSFPPQAALDDVVATLRADPRVRLAEAVGAPSP